MHPIIDLFVFIVTLGVIAIANKVFKKRKKKNEDTNDLINITES